MSYSTNGIVYEAIQRTFRNGVVEVIRQRLSARYGKEAATRVVSAFPSWSQIQAAAVESTATGVVAHPHIDEFAYLDVSHLTVLFNNYFEVLVPVEGLPPEVVAEIKRQLLAYIREIKTVRDPVAHPSDQDLDPFDALRAVDNAVRVLRQLELSEVADALGPARMELAALAAASSGGAPASTDSAIGTLPPRDEIVVDFIGRRDELGRLWEWIIDPHSRRWLLTGDGGKGKSAVAYQFASEVMRHPETQLTGVYWLSAKRRRFSEGQLVTISDPKFSDLDSAVNRLLSEFGWSEHIDKPIQTKKILLCQLVREFPCLIVVDDIDSLNMEQEDAVEFLASDLPNAGAKVLLTSRRSLLGMGKNCTIIAGLKEEDAENFIDSRLGLFGLDALGIRSEQRRRIIHLCESSPLYMEDLLRLCSFLPFDQALDSWQAQAGQNVRRYALERELEMLSGAAREVLEVCCVIDGSATALEIQRILGKGEDAVLESLAEVRRHHLAPAPELIEDVPRFGVNANLRALVRATLEGTERLRAMEAAIAAVTGGDLIGKSSRAIEDYRRQAEVLLRSGHYDKAEATLLKGLEVFPNNAQLYAGLGFVYERWKPQRVADARAAWRRAEELGNRDRRMYLVWTRLEEQQGEWQNMLKVAQMGIDRIVGDDPAVLQQAAYAASRLAQSLRASFNTERASQEFERSDNYHYKAIRAAKDRGSERHFIARSYRGLIVNSQIQERKSDLCRRLKQWIEWDPEDPTALEEAVRQGQNCPEVQEFLGRQVIRSSC
jgi:tetratricopeptide (TPR) repeat protein